MMLGSPRSASVRSASRRASTTSDQPRSARARADARPSPRDAPVISATGMSCSSLWMNAILVVEVNFKSRNWRPGFAGPASESAGGDMHTTDLLTVGEIARRSGFADSAVRYYERLGLLPATRTSGGQRRFERSTLRRLAFIRAARNIGLSLDEVAAALASLPSGRTPTRSDWSRLSRGWRYRLDDPIDALVAVRGAARRVRLVHRLRQPVAGPVRDLQPGRLGAVRRPWGGLPASRPAPGRAA